MYTKGYMVQAGNALLQNKSVFIRLQHMPITFAPIKVVTFQFSFWFWKINSRLEGSDKVPISKLLRRKVGWK